MILGFDTETTGLVLFNQPAASPTQPHLVQLAAKLMEDSGRTVQRLSLIVRPDGWIIPEAAAKVHGITTELALAVGLPLRVVLAAFTNMRSVAAECFAHNIKFDRVVIDSAVWRCGNPTVRPWPERMLCTMESSSELVSLPPTARMKAAGYDKNKPPNLGELYQFLFNKGFSNAHDAEADMEACSDCFLELRKRGMI